MFGPLLFPSLRAPAPHCYRCPLGTTREQCRIDCLGEVEKLLIAHPGEVAAVVVEPLVQGAAGMIVHPEGYLQGLRDLTRSYGTLLIADEVAVGFGRTGTLFACEQEGVSPDFLCLAKGITGGYLPLAATLDDRRGLLRLLRPAWPTGRRSITAIPTAGTRSARPSRWRPCRSSTRRTRLPRCGPRSTGSPRWLAELADHPHVGDVRQRGLIAGVELVADKATKESFPWERQLGAEVCRRARGHGLFIRPLGDVLVVMPPLAITMEQLDEMLDASSAARSTR